MSTNGYVHGPNRIKLKELDTCWDYDDEQFSEGISEDFSVDVNILLVHPRSSDIMVQEYGRYFGMLYVVCVWVPDSISSGVELHGFIIIL